MWSVGEAVVSKVIANTSPGDAWLVGPLPVRPVTDGTLGQQVVTSCQTRLEGAVHDYHIYLV